MRAMKPGSVIVDLAAESGGNCALTEPDRNVTVDGVLIISATNLPSEIPANSSQLYARNLTTFLMHLTNEGELVLDLEDEITSGTMLTHDGKITNEAARKRAEGGA